MLWLIWIAMLLLLPVLAGVVVWHGLRPRAGEVPLQPQGQTRSREDA